MLLEFSKFKLPYFLLSVIGYNLNITIAIKIMKATVYSNNLGTWGHQVQVFQELKYFK